MTEPEKPRGFSIVECIHGTVIVDADSHVGPDGARLWVGDVCTYECPKCKYPTANDRKLGVGLRLFRFLEAEPVERLLSVVRDERNLYEEQRNEAHREREEMLDLLEDLCEAEPSTKALAAAAMLVRRHGRG
jgi:hypothetical protein